MTPDSFPRTALTQAQALPPGELAARWTAQTPGADRDHLWQLLEGPGLSHELEQLAVTAALAQAVTLNLGEMLHRSAFIGATCEQLTSSTGVPAENLTAAWLTWAEPQRDAGAIPEAEFDHVAARLAGRPHEPYPYPQHAAAPLR